MMRRRGAPLLRTAVIGGGAYAMGSAAARKSAAQAELEAEQNAQIAALQQQAGQTAGTMTPPGQAYYPPQGQAYSASQGQPMMASGGPQTMPPQEQPMQATSGHDPLTALKQLGELKAAGVLTEEEFEVKKAQLLKQI